MATKSIVQVTPSIIKAGMRSASAEVAQAFKDKPTLGEEAGMVIMKKALVEYYKLQKIQASALTLTLDMVKDKKGLTEYIPTGDQFTLFEVTKIAEGQNGTDHFWFTKGVDEKGNPTIWVQPNQGKVVDRKTVRVHHRGDADNGNGFPYSLIVTGKPDVVTLDQYNVFYK
ncbi:hypothetical protein JAAARDRAFT_340500 [Jaapia argillacea MUCL 33604]|uniref:Uncharacterized protein n=1 Tax=Jaapia argillacea MUCL 33604 TaxID=933084 RepID=A0A067PXJ1_9AGAM|nr:hypothetical protein JAAARDRAFT_340500 [Jaapia argillacea MUCL 33604]